jgi:AcrR family transcriptional regulator
MASMTAAVASGADDGTYRQQIIMAAAELTARSGWSAVTMGRLAAAVGVSRQTVYNEVGSKPTLAEAMVLNELGRFLAVVERAFDANPGDLRQAIHDAVQGVLELAQDNRLLHAIASATHGTDTELLPLLTTHAESLLTTATSLVAERVTRFAPPLDAHELSVTIDAIVRVVLSHVMQPSDTPARTAENIAWLAARVARAA